MSDEIKQIAALIGHHQALEKRVSTLTEEFQVASTQLQQQSDTLSRVIRELDSASGNMTDTIRKSVNAALTQVEKELKQAGLAQQKPATEALNQAIGLLKCSEWKPSGRKKRRWLISRRVTESPALKSTPVAHLVTKKTHI